MTDAKAYITTPIYYVNDRPHIGHVYTTTICDVWARFMRFGGRDVFFLTGTDEHGVKVEKSAAARGMEPQALADENAAEFERLLSQFEFTNDDFIRTTQERHTRQVRGFVQRLMDNDVIYLGDYEGWYDEGQEEFIPEARAKDQEYKSAISGRPLVRMKEENYFFRLSRFQDALENLYAENPGFVRPEARRNEMLGRLRDGLQDVPVSRTSFKWGIPVPGADSHVLWVWIDALSNYVTALGVGDPGSEVHTERAGYWPATYHVIGKEILFFHALFWPAMLMALELPLPQCIYAHSFWISEGQKMSKSLGNFIDLEAIQGYCERYGLDTFRYFLTTNGPLGATDADFAAAHFHEVYTTDLVNTFGNCSSRVTAMIGKYFDGIVPAAANQPIGGFDLRRDAASAVEDASDRVERFDLAGGLEAALRLVRQVDAFINATQPFKLAKEPDCEDELGAILYQCLEAVRIASLLLWAVCPHKMEAFWSAIDHAVDTSAGDLASRAEWGGLVPGTKVTKVALFPRVDAEPAAV